MSVILRRTKTDLFGTHGRMEFGGDILCHTIERHDARLCPEGVFACEPHIKSNNGQKCWILNNVPGKTGILIHTGNTEGDSEGCIIIGLQPNAQGVVQSKLALQKLQRILPSHFTLKITSTLL